jgi:excisionase family DNA binding protein
MKVASALTRTTPRADWPELLRAEEVAAVADLGRGTVYDLIRRGELPSVKFGRVVRVPRAGLVALLERGR